jgi:hypothetical protein
MSIWALLHQPLMQQQASCLWVIHHSVGAAFATQNCIPL